MNWKTVLPALVLIGFAALTAYSIREVGYFGIWLTGLADPGGWQILVDLIIVCTLAIGWMIQDARARGLSVWPYIVITLVGGAFGPLLYLLRRNWSTNHTTRPASQRG